MFIPPQLPTLKTNKAMKNIHVLKTDKPSRLYLTTHEYIFEEGYSLSTDECENKHIYITNDEQIKEWDWIYCTERKLFGKVIEIQLAKFKSDTSMLYFEINNEEIWCKLFNCKKIILTTDQDLIKDGVQGIDDEFLEWFVQNPNCESVKVDILKRGIYDEYKYKIIIPKKEPKQETLEEAAENSFLANKLENSTAVEKAHYIAGFRECAKWQQKRSYSEKQMDDAYDKGFKDASERMYSEEEVFKILVQSVKDSGSKQLRFFDGGVLHPIYTNLNKWFEQFKKK